MYFFRLIEKKQNNPNLFRIIFGPLLEGQIKNAQLVHLSNKKYNFDYAFQMTNDGIFYFYLDNSLFNTNPVLQHFQILSQYNYLVETQDENSLEMQDIYTYDPNNNQISINQFYKNIIEVYANAAIQNLLKSMSNQMLVANSGLSYDVIFSYRSNTQTITNNFTWNGYNLYDGDLSILQNYKYFFYITLNYLPKDYSMHSTIYLPNDTLYFEIIQINISNNELIFNKHIKIQNVMGRYRVLCFTNDPNNLADYTELNPNEVYSLTHDGKNGLHVHFFISPKEFIIKEIPIMDSSYTNKSKDFHEDMPVSHGFLDILQDVNKQIVDKAKVYRFI